MRNSHLLAIAPNASSSIICGGTSPSIEPFRANVYTHKTLTGSYKVKNKYLERLLEEKEINTEKLWKQIAAADGSVKDIKELSDDEKEILSYRKLIVSHSKNPIDTSYLNFKDLIGFEKSCNLAKSIGFGGKACIHPGQIEISNKIF